MVTNVNVKQDSKERTARRTSTNALESIVKMGEPAKIRSTHSNVFASQDSVEFSVKLVS